MGEECVYQTADDSGVLCDVSKYTDNNTAAGYRLSRSRPGFYLQLQAYTSDEHARIHAGRPQSYYLLAILSIEGLCTVSRILVCIPSNPSLGE
jgi:hypothetical protein